MCIGCTYRISTGEPYHEYIFCPELLNPEPDTSLYRLVWERVPCSTRGLEAKRLPLKTIQFENMRKWLKLSGKKFSSSGEQELKRLFDEYGKNALDIPALLSIKHPALASVRYFRQVRFQQGFVLIGNNFAATNMGMLKLSGSPRALADVLEDAYSGKEVQEEEKGDADAIARALAEEGILKFNRVGFAAYPKSGAGAFGSGRKTFAKVVRKALELNDKER